MFKDAVDEFYVSELGGPIPTAVGIHVCILQVSIIIKVFEISMDIFHTVKSTVRRIFIF